MLLAEVAAVSEALAGTRARGEKTRLLAECLAAAGPDEVGTVISYLAGELRQRRTGLGWAALKQLPPPAPTPTLTVADVDAAMERIAVMAGAGSGTARRDELRALMARATTQEQRFLAGLVLGEVRHGALEGVAAEAVAAAAGLPAPDVRRAVMLRGSLPPVAVAALTEGAAGLARFRLEVGRPVQPMLASTAGDVAAALDRTGEASVETKLDGIRVQVHRQGAQVAVFTRTLENVTSRMPEVVEATLALPARSLVLDGEAIALRPDGRPYPFEVTGSRTARRLDVAAARAATPLSVLWFDVLLRDGRDLLGEELRVRREVLADLVPPAQLVPAVATADAEEAAAVLAGALARGHEGVVVKALSSPYEAGRRGAAWVKVKPHHTLDLVVLAAEWGSGRRRGWLSNLHLGARADDGEGFVMLGKTFKGLTDEMLRWQTEALLALETSRAGHVVHVRPELVVEVAFDGVQTSPRYPGGVALRFARVVRHRPDKPARQADRLAAVRAVHVAR